MLFPTIERMATSSNGFYLTRIVAPFYFLVRWFLSAFLLLPVFAQTFLIYMYFLIFSIPETFLGTALKYAAPSVMEKVYFMAKDEMRRVKAVDVDVIKENVKLLKFYYGASDGWVPVKYYKELKEKVPGLEAEVDTKKIEHAFVLRSSNEMGNIVAEWIRDNRKSMF